MKQFKKIMLFILLLFVALNPSTGFAERAENQAPGVVCTTSILAHLTEQIGAESLAITTIAPVGMCPAHFDIKPSQIQAVSEAELLISHDFEPWIESLLISANNRDIERLIFSGPWNTPDSAIDKINQIADVLGNLFPESEEKFSLNAQQFIQNIKRKGNQLKSRAENFGVSRYKAIASFHQVSFLEWLGLQVIADYPSPEMISTKQFYELLLIGKKEMVHMVVDNLQSGTDFGARLASDLNAAHVALTNFPGLIPQTDSLAAMMSYNAEQIFQVIEENSGHD